MTVRAETVLAGVRASYGAIQVALPGYSAEELLGGPLDATTVRVVRVLGARQLAQAGLGVGVDALHALSMVPLALATPRWRRPALVSGLMAAAFAAAGLLAARRIPGHRTVN